VRRMARSKWEYSFLRIGRATWNAHDESPTLGRAICPSALALRIVRPRSEIRPSDLAESDDFAHKLPLWQRIKGALAHGPPTLAALAEELGEKPDSLKKVVDRSQKRPDPMFTRVPGGADGTTRISLVVRRIA
jgi:hypothetical protein